MALRTARYRGLIEAVAELVDLPAWSPERHVDTYSSDEWLEGLILTESAGDPRAVRYEAHQDRTADADTPNHDDGLLEDDKSYGLMQVMGYNIRALVGVSKRTRMNFGWALLPVANLSLGVRVLLAELKATEGDVARALARFNGGPTGERIMADGRMRRQVYVDKVARNCRRVVADRAA